MDYRALKIPFCVNKGKGITERAVDINNKWKKLYIEEDGTEMEDSN